MAALMEIGAKKNPGLVRNAYQAVGHLLTDLNAHHDLAVRRCDVNPVAALQLLRPGR